MYYEVEKKYPKTVKFLYDRFKSFNTEETLSEEMFKDYIMENYCRDLLKGKLPDEIIVDILAHLPKLKKYYDIDNIVKTYMTAKNYVIDIEKLFDITQDNFSCEDYKTKEETLMELIKYVDEEIDDRTDSLSNYFLPKVIEKYNKYF